MQIIELLHRDGPFEEYRVSLTAEERGDRVDGRTFRALSLVETIYRRYGIVAAMLAAIPLAIWSDLQN